MAETLQSVRQALNILKLLRQHPTLGVSEIAALLAVSSSTAHRLLATMSQVGFVRQAEPGRKYELGPAMQFAGHTSAVEHCIEVGTTHMIALRDASSETVHLAVLTGAATRFVAAFESPLMMRVTSRVGRELPAHTTAAGKVLLGRLDDEQFAELYRNGPLDANTSESIDTLPQLRAAVASARELGYAVNRGESEQGVAAIAVPLHHPSGRITCALSLTGPEARFNPGGSIDLSSREAELLRLLRSAAAAIESELAF